MELQAQYATAILMSVAGATLGAVYDMYRTCIKEWRFLRIYSALLDLSFWGFAVLFVFTLLLGANDGDVRIVVFVLLSLGWLVYYYTAHALVVASTRLVVRVLYQVLWFIYRMFVIVFVMPLVYVFKVFVYVLHVLDRVLLMVEPVIVWPVIKTGDGLLLTNRGIQKIVLPWWKKGKDNGMRMANKYKTIIAGWLQPSRPNDEDRDDEDET